MITITKIGNWAQIIAGLTFVSSFFVKDNDKAVNRRWISLGLFAAGAGMRLYGYYNGDLKQLKLARAANK